MAAKLKKGDKVVVLSGRDKGEQGEITRVIPSKGRAIVQGINTYLRHRKQSQDTQGGRVSTELPIDMSNLALVDPKQGGPTRVGFKVVDGVKRRFAKKSGEIIDG